MRSIKVFFLIILLTGIFQFQSDLDALVRSRIQGLIKDKESHDPLKGVIVHLYVQGEKKEYYSTMKTNTDENGGFVFDQIKPGTYIVSCEKKGYATYQPDYKIMSFLSPFYSQYIDLIYLKEGEIRYLIIEMEKGGSVHVKIFKKDTGGISPYNRFHGSIALTEGEEIFDVDQIGNLVGKDGEYFFEGLPASDKYEIDIQAISHTGYPIFRTNFAVKKDEAITITHTFNFTDNTGIYGIVSFEGTPLDYGTVDLYDADKNTVSSVTIPGDGEYAFKNIKPGVYTINAGFLNFSNRKRYQVNRTVIIEKNVFKEFNIKIK